MAAVTICSDFGVQKKKSVTVSIVSPSIYHEVMGPDAMIIVFGVLRFFKFKVFFSFFTLQYCIGFSFKSAFFLSSFTLIKRLFSSSSLSAIRVVSSVYLMLLIFLPAILIPACASSSSAFLIMYSVYKLNKHGVNIQPWRTPFPIWNQSVVPWPVLTVASWPAYRFLRRQVRWCGIPIPWRIFHTDVIHTVKGFCVVNKAVVDVFLELSWFFNDPVDVGNLISSSSAFSKSSLNIWKLTVHVLLKPGLENFEHYFASVWDECNCVVVFGITFLWDWNENWSCPVLWPLLSFPKLLAYWMQYFNSIIFYALKQFNWIPSPPLPLFIVMLPKIHLTSHSRMSGYRWVIIPSWLSGSRKYLLYSSSTYSCYLFLISSASVRFVLFCPLLGPSLHEIFSWYL